MSDTTNLTADATCTPVADDATVTPTPDVTEAPDAGKLSGKKKKPTKPASKPATSGKADPSARLSIKQAAAAAIKTGNAAEGEALYLVPLSQIKQNDNPRHEPARLFDYDFFLIGDPIKYEPVEGQTEGEVRHCLRDMALSDDMDAVREFVSLIECYEAPMFKMLNAKGALVMTGTEYECKLHLRDKVADANDRKAHKLEPLIGADQSIVELAADLIEYDSDGNGTNFVPAVANRIGTTEDWNLIDGGRRATAILYNHAKSRVQIADSEEGAPKKPYPAVIKVEDRRVKKGEQMNVAVLLNTSRKGMTEWQMGKLYYDFCQQENPDTKRPYTMKEAAAKLGVPYGTFRNRHALAEPFVKDEFDEGGKLKKKGKGLSPADRKKMISGELTVTAATRKALREKQTGDGRPVTNRTPKIMKKEAIEALFDKTPPSNVEFRKALASVMLYEGEAGFKQAVADSDARIAKQDAGT